ncbi:MULTISPECIES: GDSL-type esterase/lipase family protein [Micrococcus]|uniref:GDSL-like Lipase/Acylhydrolase family protein n=1 Tax=Micrococcus terreus TaxID=574650 RepID=A0A1I7MH76_9MICC|nr:GDSL-type esterase/lipase family protein [Micrococcus terreus]SFV21274.1 GDSL-like Lipase/Acylhydrolase family protein [Micrococcus terreus]
MEIRRIRIASVGNELLAGVGDPRALGWLGRVLAKTSAPGVQLESYVLAQPGEGTEALSARWQREAEARYSEETENRLVIGLSDLDLDLETSTARARLNLANILDRAAQLDIRTLVVGPVPSLDNERNARLAELNTAYLDVADRRRHYYVDTFTPLVNHEQWRNDLAAGHGLPGQAGYGLIAWLVLHRGWYQWLGVPEPTA